MKLLVFCLLFAFNVSAQSAADEIVPIKDLIPDIVFDIRYATINNFTSQKLYTTNESYLSTGAIARLKLVHDSLKNITSFNGVSYPAGLGIKVFDGYRPRSVQYLMFEIFPNPVFVADPATGSVHNRGGAVDVSLVDMATGNELQMPTEFDWFGPEADHGYMNLPANVIANRQLLRDMMVNVGGFIVYMAEWWHYSIPGAGSLPLLDFQMK
ncbi:MAG: M15 family metallopeptidase [Ignavibacteriaceae bacterium]|nr:M15 family metallopeptidase [Ignavibacteriaceae bacterium]